MNQGADRFWSNVPGEAINPIQIQLWLPLNSVKNCKNRNYDSDHKENRAEQTQSFLDLLLPVGDNRMTKHYSG